MLLNSKLLTVEGDQAFVDALAEGLAAGTPSFGVAVTRERKHYMEQYVQFT